MECEETLQVKKYLNRFDQILCQMANKMLLVNMYNNITLNFIKCMIPHHQAAIYMCENLLKYSNFEPLQKIAYGIIKMQTKGIKQMKEIANTTLGFNSSKMAVYCYATRYFPITENMVYRMKNSPRCKNINLNFVNEMIPHHEGAIEMCNNLLQYYIDPRLRYVANNIINEQSRGVRQLMEVKDEQLCR